MEAVPMLTRALTTDEAQQLKTTMYEIDGINYNALASSNEETIKNIQAYINDGKLVQEHDRYILVLNNPFKYKSVYKEKRGTKLCFYGLADHTPQKEQINAYIITNANTLTDEANYI
jgi:hypothetical protein